MMINLKELVIYIQGVSNMPKSYSRNTNYWIKEQAKLKNYGFRLADDLNQLTLSQYSKVNTEMKKELKRFYDKYYKVGEFKGITTKIRASELEQLRRDYNKILNSLGITRQQALGRLKLDKLLDQLDIFIHRLNIKLMIPQTDVNENQLRQMLIDTYERNYYRSVYMVQKGTNIMGSFARVSTKAIEKVVNNKFAGSTFSDRIWNNKNDMMFKMKEEMLNIVTHNKSRQDAVKSLSRRLEVNYSDAKRVIYTEQARIMSEVSEDSYKTTGVEQFEYVATLDDGTSDKDKAIDGNVYDLKDYQVGVNAEPLHPYCRGTTVPFFDDIETSRIGRDLESGKSEFMPTNVKTYGDWEKLQGLDS